MPTAPLSAWFGNIKPITSISEEAAPFVRICNVLEAISISLLLQCCSSRCTRWKLWWLQRLCAGGSWRRHASAFIDTGIASARKVVFCLLCPNISHWGCTESERLLAISGVLLCWWQGLTVFSSSWDLTFSNLLLVGPGVPKLTAHRWRGVLLEASNCWEVREYFSCSFHFSLKLYFSKKGNLNFCRHHVCTWKNASKNVIFSPWYYWADVV